MLKKYLTRDEAEEEVLHVLDKYEDDWSKIEIVLNEDCDLKNVRIKALVDELKDHFMLQKYRAMYKVTSRVKRVK